MKVCKLFSVKKFNIDGKDSCQRSKHFVNFDWLIEFFTDPLSEKRSSTVYVPRDESFSEVKQLTFSTKTLSSGLKALVPALKTLIVDKNLGFPVFSAIDDLFDEGLYLPPLKGIRSILPRLVRHIKDIQEDILLFDPPATMNSKRYSLWFSI